MAQSYELIFRRITRRFGSFPTKTYSNRILSYVNVLITEGELQGRALEVHRYSF